MKLDIKNRNKNPLLSREEINAEISFQNKTPSRKELLEQAHKTLNVKKELIIIKNITTTYGASTAKVLIYLYGSKEDLAKIEPEYVRKKHEEKKAEPAEDAVTPAEKTEPAKEQKKEDKPESNEES